MLVGTMGSATIQPQYWADNCIVQRCKDLFHKCMHSIIDIVCVSHIEYRDIYILTLSIYDLTASYSAAN